MQADATPWSARPRVAVDLDRTTADRFAGLPSEQFAASRTLLDATLSGVPNISELAQLIDARTASRFRRECEHLAAHLKTSWQTVMVANAAYDLTLASFACSSAAIATPTGPVLFRNMDWWPEDLLAKASCVVSYHCNGQPTFEAAGWAAAAGIVTGISRRGFAVALNAVAGLEGTDLEGYPVLLFLRTVLEDAESYEHAVSLLTDAHLTSPALFLVCLLYTSPSPRDS